MQMGSLADAAYLSRSGLTRMVDSLEHQGLLVRRKGERDPRQVFAAITERGLRRLAETMPTHLGVERERFLDKLSRSQLQQLAHIWEQLLEDQPEGGEVS